MRRSILFLILLIFCSTFVAAFESGKYPYYKKIILPSSINEPAIIGLDLQILNNMKPDGSDLVVTENNDEIPIKVLINHVEEVAHKGKIISASSIRQEFRGANFDASKVLDGDYSNNDNAYYQIDSVKDPNYAWIILELNDKTLTDQAKIWSLNTEYTWTELQIEGSNDNFNWDMVKSKKKYEVSDVRTVTYPPVQYNFLKFSFWHTQSLVINEIEIYGAYAGKAIFFAKSGNEYKIYYGNKAGQPPIPYDTSQLSTKKTTPAVSLGIQENNKNYNFDSDNDGITKDNCPTISNSDQKESDNDGIGDLCDNCPGNANSDQKDTDNDGIGNICDNCAGTFNPDQYDDNSNGKGFACDDNDNDGVINSQDNCPSTSNSNQNDKDRNGIGDACEDFDKDDIPFSKDNCLNKPNPDQKDTDKDGIGDVCDNCLLGFNSDQYDRNQDKIGDVCEDEDNDNAPNYNDNCKGTFNDGQKDTDNDGLGDICDNCPIIKNPEQSDSDRNGIGDICDDSDNDGLINPRDNCPQVPNKGQEDQNNNAVGDACEDFDNDGVLNNEDNCLYDYNPKQNFGSLYIQSDTDKDGKGDACDKADSRFTENKKGLISIIVALTVVIVGFLAWRLNKMPVKK